MAPNCLTRRLRPRSSGTLIVAVAAFLVIFGNAAYFTGVLDRYPPVRETAWPLLTLPLVLFGVTVFLLGVLCVGRAIKPVLVLVLLLSSAAACFMDAYGVVISDDMLRNVAQTNPGEALELVTPRLVAYVLLLGVLPALLVIRTPVLPRSPLSAVYRRLRLLAVAGTLVVFAVLSAGGFYASFVREHKDLRQHANPAYYLYSMTKYLGQLMPTSAARAPMSVGTDAAIPANDVTRELVIMVVGETARADRFGLNGYARDTTPELTRHGAASFTDVRACGTSTAVSVPCMFLLGGEAKGAGRIRDEENLLDVLAHAGVHVLWRDNNSDSKGVAARVTYQDFRSAGRNPVCDAECRDVGMLHELQDYINARPSGDIFIVLHQMGNHGPAYYRRYPAAFEKFGPACREADLARCTREEIGNAYDNAILYTDYFLGQVIELLKRNDARFETALLYVSDHGESLGENNIYLHGLPKPIAPKQQLQVPAVMWFGKHFRAVDRLALRDKTGRPFSHENIFHTVLGFFEITSSAYDPAKDMLHGAKPTGVH